LITIDCSIRLCLPPAKAGEVDRPKAAERARRAIAAEITGYFFIVDAR